MARTYLVVIDDSPEARVALRFAARRAAKTGGAVDVLASVEPQDFVQWGGVQAAIEEEQRLRIEGIVASHGEIMDAAESLRKLSFGRATPSPRFGAISALARMLPRWSSALLLQANRVRWLPISPATTRASCPSR